MSCYLVIFPSTASATPTLRELTNELDSVLEWHLLGVKLDLKTHELGEIERNYRSDGIRRCKTEMLSRWLGNTTNPTWEAVVDALRQMRANAVADTIERNNILHTATSEGISANLTVVLACFIANLWNV